MRIQNALFFVFMLFLWGNCLSTSLSDKNDSVQQDKDSLRIDIFLIDSLYHEKSFDFSDSTINWFVVKCASPQAQGCFPTKYWSQISLGPYRLDETTVEFQKEHPNDTLVKVIVKKFPGIEKPHLIIRTRRKPTYTHIGQSSPFELELIPGQDVYGGAFPVLERGYSPLVKIIPTGTLIATNHAPDTVKNYDITLLAELKPRPMFTGTFKSFSVKDLIPEMKNDYIEKTPESNFGIINRYNLPSLVALIDFNGDFYPDLVVRYEESYYIIVSELVENSRDQIPPELNYRLLNKTKLP